MSRRVYFLLGAFVLFGNACNESSEYSLDYAVCNSDSFSPNCESTTSHTACVENKVVIQDCDGNKTCLNGICQDHNEAECSPASYISTCVDDNNKYICNSLNKIDQESCPEGTKCAGGSCIAENLCIENCELKCSKSEYEAAATKLICPSLYECQKIGENEYNWEIIDSYYCEHGCDQDKTECAKLHEDEGKSCSQVEGDENYYANRCEGNIHLFCNGEGKVVVKDCDTLSCNSGIGCYEPCDTAGEIIYSCFENWAYDDEGNIDELIDYTLYESTCEEDTVYHVKHLEQGTIISCDMVCEESSGKCI